MRFSQNSLNSSLILPKLYYILIARKSKKTHNNTISIYTVKLEIDKNKNLLVMKKMIESKNSIKTTFFRILENYSNGYF